MKANVVMEMEPARVLAGKLNFLKLCGIILIIRGRIDIEI